MPQIIQHIPEEVDWVRAQLCVYRGASPAVGCCGMHARGDDFIHLTTACPRLQLISWVQFLFEIRRFYWAKQRMAATR